MCSGTDESGHYVGELDDFPEGDAQARNVAGIDMAICNVDSEFYAITDTCPHKSYPLSGAPDADSEPGPTFRELEDRLYIECPWHQLQWDIVTGESRINLQSIGTFDVSIEDESVFVEL